MGRMMVIVMMIKDPIYNDDFDEDFDVVTVLLVGDHGLYQRLNFGMNSESEYNVIIEELYSLICDCLIVIVYQGSDVVDSLIYNKYQDVDDPLRFDIYEDCVVIIDWIFDTHSKKLSMIQSILCVSRLLKRDLIFNDYPHVEIEDSNTHGEHPDENFDEYLDNERIETLDDLDILDETL